MSRTAHHQTYRHTARREAPHRAAELYDLRYSRTALAAATDHRPLPRQVRRAFQAYDYGRAFRSSSWMRYAANHAERQARQTLRGAMTRARGLHRAGHDDDVIVAPARHRHGALWDSW